MDLALALAEELLVDFVWTDELLEEWERVTVREGKRTPQTARSVSTAVRHYFAATRIEPALYREQVATVRGRDPADRVHTAACAYGAATVLLTRNQRDFPTDFLAGHGVTVTTADEYLAVCSAADPAPFSTYSGSWPPTNTTRRRTRAIWLTDSVEQAPTDSRSACGGDSPVPNQPAQAAHDRQHQAGTV